VQVSGADKLGLGAICGVLGLEQLLGLVNDFHIGNATGLLGVVRRAADGTDDDGRQDTQHHDDDK
jgi:hypothetical protein